MGQETAKRFGFKIDSAPAIEAIKTTDILQKQVVPKAPTTQIKEFLKEWADSLEDGNTIRDALLDKIKSL